MSITHDAVTALVRQACDENATEIHFKVPQRPLIRVKGALLPIGEHTLTPRDTHQIGNVICGMGSMEVPLATVTHREFSFGLPKLGRFHATLTRQRGSLCISLMRIALEATPLDALGFDTRVEALLRRPGLILLAGGARRHELLNSLVDRYNASNRSLAVVVEHPLTCLHRDGMATIVQRGIGCDVPDFETGVHSAQRMHADLLGVGEVPDRPTAEALVRAAEEGLCVLACVAAPSADLARTWITRHYRDEDDTHIGARLERVTTATMFVGAAGEPGVVADGEMLKRAS